MSPERFCRYELRTTEVEAAREFYARLLGHERAIVWPLHEQARARGAVPHWLGSVGVEGEGRFQQIEEELVGRGAMLLGAPFPTPDGGKTAIVRDPGGAILAFTSRSGDALVPTVDVAWHALNTGGLPAARNLYQALFGWTIAAEPTRGPFGDYHEFWWDGTTGPSAGAMADIAGRPEVHPHWLFCFRIGDLDAAVERIRAAGGTATDPITGPGGARFSVCEDPQRAAFGLTGK